VQQQLVASHGIPPLVGLLNSPAATQVWVLGVLARLANNSTSLFHSTCPIEIFEGAGRSAPFSGADSATAAAFQAVLAAGLDQGITHLLTSRSPLIQELFPILGSPGSLTRSISAICLLVAGG
jgi:hypothetical protein